MEKEFKDHSLFTARIILGLIFAAAAAGKIHDPHAFAELIKNYQILPDFLINEAALFLPYIELFTAIMLFAGIFLKGASLLSSLMLLVFISILIFNVSRGLNISCGCFSSTFEEVTNLHSIYYLVRDLIFLSISFYIAKNVFLKKDNR